MFRIWVSLILAKEFHLFFGMFFYIVLYILDFSTFVLLALEVTSRRVSLFCVFQPMKISSSVHLLHGMGGHCKIK